MGTGLTAQEAAKNAVREAADIVEIIGERVALKRAGARYLGLCPFHSEKTPSFAVNPQDQFFYCFGCGAKGDVFSFVMQYERVDFPEALKRLAERYQIVLPERDLSEAEKARLKEREVLYAVYEAATRCYESALWDEKLGRTGRDYLQGRAVPDAAARQYRLGFAPDPDLAGWDWLSSQLVAEGRFGQDLLLRSGLSKENRSGKLYDSFRKRVLFPLLDMSGQVTAFGGRILGEGQPKYMNSPESLIFSKSRQLFGLYPHREAIKKSRCALVVEGNFDLLSLAVHGVDNVVAPLGTALTRDHVHALSHYCDQVCLLFDADTAGLKAAMRSIPFFLEEGLEARVAQLPEGHDPDSFVREQGKSAMEALLAKAQPLAEFALNRLIAEHGLTLGGKARIVQALKPLLQAAGKREQRDLMAAHFAARLGLSADYFSGRRPAPEAPPPLGADEDWGAEQAAPRPPDTGSLRQLSRQERQVLDFLLFWPEYCQPLVKAGLGEVLKNPTLAHLLDLMLEAGETGTFSPEQLLSAPLAPEDRACLVERLTEPLLDLDTEAVARAIYEEIVHWVRQQQKMQRAARLQRELVEAEQCGDSQRALDLLRARQQEAGSGDSG